MAAEVAPREAGERPETRNAQHRLSKIRRQQEAQETKNTTSPIPFSSIFFFPFSLQKFIAEIITGKEFFARLVQSVYFPEIQQILGISGG